MFPVPVAAYTFLLATCKSADSVSLCMFLVICSNPITRKCCELNRALILLTLIFLNR